MNDDAAFRAIQQDLVGRTGLAIKQWDLYLQGLKLREQLESLELTPRASIDEVTRVKEAITEGLWMHTQLQNQRFIWLANQTTTTFYLFMHPSFDYTLQWLMEKRVLLDRVVFIQETKQREFDDLAFAGSMHLNRMEMKQYPIRESPPPKPKQEKIPEPMKVPDALPMKPIDPTNAMVALGVSSIVGATMLAAAIMFLEPKQKK